LIRPFVLGSGICFGSALLSDHAAPICG
jgi:hypothetical protein